jgi:hypothetical protein
MTSIELERTIQEELGKAGALKLLDQRESQFLEVPGGLFAELVLGDGSRLVDVERVARGVREALSKRGVDLSVIVRSIWTVQSVGDAQAAISLTGGIRSAWSFPATLVSGGLKTQVEVEVTMLAVDEIKRKLKGSADPVDERSAIKEVVKEFLKLQLSFGGESYWDPIRYPKQELNDSALLYLFGQSSVGRG